MKISSESTYRSGLPGLPLLSVFSLVLTGFLLESLLCSEVFSGFVFKAVTFSSDMNEILGNKEAASAENRTVTLEQRGFTQNESKSNS